MEDSDPRSHTNKHEIFLLRVCSFGFVDHNCVTMMKAAFTLALAFILFAFSPARVTPNTAPLPKAEDDFQIVKVADGVYAAIAKSGGLASGNAGFVIGNDGVLIFDTFFTPVAITS